MDCSYVFECVRNVLDWRNTLNDENEVKKIKTKGNYMKNISPQICTKVILKKTHSSTFKILLLQPHIFPVRLKISIFLPREYAYSLCLLIETNVLWEDINKKNKLKIINENCFYFWTYDFHSQHVIARARKISERQGDMGKTFFMLSFSNLKFCTMA